MTTTESRDAQGTPPLPSLAARYLRYVLIFLVTLALGLAPLLDQVPIPGVSSILSLFPQNLKEVVVPFAAFVLAIPAVALQYFATDRIKRYRRPKTVLALLLGCALVSFILLFMYLGYVVRVNYAGDQYVAYVIAPDMRPSCPCALKGLEIEECIGFELSTKPSDVDACFMRSPLVQRKAQLAAAYIVLMGLFGSVIGLLVAKESAKANPIKRRANGERAQHSTRRPRM